MKAIFLLAALCFVGSVGAQNPAALRWERTEWDFGTIQEIDGTVHYTFRFTNQSDQAVVVERVSTDCGCTATTFGREPVRSGERGWVEIAFDPKGAWGRLTKTVVVFAGGGQGFSLQIKVNVVPRARSINETYPIELGEGVRLGSVSEAFGYMAVGGSISRVVEIVNTGEAAVQIEAVAVGSGKLRVDVPRRLVRNQQAQITVTYDLAGQAVYGMLADRIILKINGIAQSTTIYATGIAVDSFAGVDRATAPRCDIKPRFYNFGQVRAGAVVSQEITITNTGQKPLILRRVMCRPNTSFSLADGAVVGVGKSVKATVTFTVSDGYGVVAGGVTIIVNDPELPMQEIRVVAEIRN